MRNYLSIPLSSMEGGVNRFETEAKRNQTVDAIDVINDDGYLRRRDSYETIACGTPHYMPKGSVFVMTSNAALSESVSDLRVGYGTISGSAIKRLYIGTPEKFDGISWESVTSSVAPSKSFSLRMYYSTVDAEAIYTWTEAPYFKDTTRSRIGNYMAPLCREGQISWHSTDLADWAAAEPTAIKSDTAFTATYLGDITQLYWIRLDIVATATGAADYLTSSLVTAKPGVRAFQLQPVNGLFPVRLADRSVLVVCNDRSRTGGASNVRAHEPGSQVGIVKNHHENTEVMRLVEDEGLGTYGTSNWPTWNDSGTVSGTYGTASYLEKSDKNYDWMSDLGTTEPRFGQFRGATLVEGLVPQDAAGYGQHIIRVLSSALSPATNEFDHCRLRLTDNSGESGNTVGTEVEIWRTYTSGSYTYIQVYSGFGVALDGSGGDRVAIVAPHARAVVQTLNGNAAPEDLEVFVHHTTSGHMLSVVSAEYARAPSSDATNSIVNFELSRETRWSIDGGHRYSGVYDRTTKKLIFTNGKSPLMETDGHRLRELAADTTSETAKAIAGELQEKDEDSETEFSLNARAMLLHKPPRGDFVVDYRGRIVVGNRDTNEVIYNWPGKGDIWPRGYRFVIRDGENNAISGMSTLHDSLVVFTPTAIFDCGPPNNLGFFSVRPASQGIGFTSHWAVQRVSTRGSSALIGPGTDGVYLYTGSEPLVILDDWRRLLKGGVNEGRLRDAVAAVSFSRNLYFLAVASAGSEVNNRVLVFDWARKNWWVWSAPHGVSFMATDYDEAGQERVMFGTNDGHVQVMTGGLTDDGQTITGRAKTAPLAPFRDREGSFVSTLGSYLDLGEASAGVGHTMTVSAYTDKRETARSSKALSLDGNQSSWDVHYWQEDTGQADPSWGDDRLLQKRVNHPPSTKGNLFQVQISGTRKWKMRDLTLMARRLDRRGR